VKEVDRKGEQMTKGDSITITVNGRKFDGTVRFACADAITVDESNGITAIIKKNPATDGWQMGKHAVTLETISFSERLSNLVKKARAIDALVCRYCTFPEGPQCDCSNE
jgi:hypothetical protein